MLSLGRSLRRDRLGKTMKQIDLVRTLPVACALGALVYMAAAQLARNPAGPMFGFMVGIIVSSAFCIQIRLGHFPWFEKKDCKAHRFIVWLEGVFPFLRAPRK